MTNKYKKHNKKEGYISTSPLPSENELRKFYADYYYQDPKTSSYQSEYDELEFNYKDLKCKSLIYALNSIKTIPGKVFLDVGAGEGFLLNAADKEGLNVTGLDFSSFGVDKFFPHLSSKHISGDIYESLNMLIEKEKRFSMCASTNVLEHVLDPELFLSLIKKVLEPKGLLAITVPNDFSDIQQFALEEGMIDREFWFVPPHHLNYFNTDTLPEYMRKNGFEVLDAFTDFPIDFYLLHKGSNYVMNQENGPDANKARIKYDLMIHKKKGMEAYIDYYRGLYKAGLGRNITIIVRSIID
jgi:2-polyprenyl-3-methyl-5-hydroxy-6-metoxy-1,4-benzoquinol methylase